MKISIHTQGTEISEQMRELITKHVQRDLDTFRDNIQTVRVELADINGPRSGGVDKRCHITASVHGIGQVAGRSSAATLTSAATIATRRIRRQLLEALPSPKCPSAQPAS
jgi:ribosome-associated translation inhibitor RaiA